MKGVGVAECLKNVLWALLMLDARYSEVGKNTVHLLKHLPHGCAETLYKYESL